MLFKPIFVVSYFLACARTILSYSQRPNIIVFTADDLGWNDVSFHDRSHQIPTPNIDALGLNGVILNNHYTQPMCTPSRAALMTGEYPIHTGTQHSDIKNGDPWGLPLNRKLLPEHLRDIGYSTYLVGKWHLGFWKKAHTPLQRGFDHHYGFWGAEIDYWTKTSATAENPKNRGRDLRNDYQVVHDNKTYVTDLFTDAAVNYVRQHPRDQPLFLMVNHFAPHAANAENPHQAPESEIAKFAHIKNPARRVYAAMVSKLDQSIGEVVAVLKEEQMLSNSIILFLSDNGAPTKGPQANSGSNYPFRGQKGTPWEGGVRTPAVIWSPLIYRPRRVSNQLIHITDWMPTLLSAAGVYPTELRIDGVDQWSSIAYDVPSKRREVLVNINTVKGWGAIIRDGWKLVKGVETPDFNDWLSGPRPMHLDENEYVAAILESAVYQAIGALRKNEILQLTEEATIFCGPIPLASSLQCRPSEVCLFNLNQDKCEYYNIAPMYPQKVNELSMALMNHARTAQGASIASEDVDACPSFYNNTWTYWGDLIQTQYHGVSRFEINQPRALGGFLVDASARF